MIIYFKRDYFIWILKMGLICVVLDIINKESVLVCMFCCLGIIFLVFSYKLIKWKYLLDDLFYVFVMCLVMSFYFCMILMNEDIRYSIIYIFIFYGFFIIGFLFLESIVCEWGILKCY